MRQIDVAISTQARVRELPDRPYIATMCVVIDVLNCLYEDLTSEKLGGLYARRQTSPGAASRRLNSGEIALSVFLSMEAIRDDPKSSPGPC